MITSIRRLLAAPVTRVPSDTVQQFVASGLNVGPHPVANPWRESFVGQHSEADVVGRIGHQHHVCEQADQGLDLFAGSLGKPFRECGHQGRGQALVAQCRKNICVPGEHAAVETLAPMDRVLFSKLLITRIWVGDGGGVNRRWVIEGGGGRWTIGHSSRLALRRLSRTSRSFLPGNAPRSLAEKCTDLDCSDIIVRII